MDLVMFVRNFLQPDLLGRMFLGTLYLFYFCKCVMYALIFWHFTMQSVSLLSTETHRDWTPTIKNTTIASCVIYLVYELVELIFLPDSHEICFSLLFVFGSTVQLAIATLFVIFALKVQRVTDAQNDQIIDRLV